MVIITLQDFLQYDRDSIYEYLLLQEETSFEVEMRLLRYPTPGNGVIVQSNYTLAAYVAQLLSGLSKKFTYSVPGITALPLFQFRAIIKDMEKLADVLFNIINGTYYDNSRSKEFHNDIETFWAEVCGYGVSPVAWGLIHIANRYVDGQDD